MKICSSCKEEKHTKDFYKKGKENRTNSMCKSCFNSYCADRWRKRKEKIVEQFGNKCYDCSRSYHPNIYDFHHTDPKEKEMTWSRMRLLSEEKMQKELKKCVMLCANCHRHRHIEPLSS